MTKSASARWRHLAPQLAEADLLTDRFRDVLAIYCETWAEYWQHHKTLREEGFTTTAGNGTTIPHPCVAMKDKCQTQLLKYQRELGMTPAAATGLGGLDEPTDDDPLAGMEKRGRPSLKITSAG